jgi:hypothetical protein
VALSAALMAAKKMGSFRKKQRRRFSSLLHWRLSKAHTRPATVLVDELDADLLKRPANG